MNGWFKAAGAALVTALATYTAFLLAERARPYLEQAADEAEARARHAFDRVRDDRRQYLEYRRDRNRVLWEAHEILIDANEGGPT